MAAPRVRGDESADELDKEPSPRGSDSTAPGSIRTDCASAEPWWTLIWCHERCHKQECDSKREMIAATSRDSGASLVCLKKATKFATWAELNNCSPYGLLTDWREVKPCLQAVSILPLHLQPVFTIIYCELPKHLERATAWAQTAGAGDQVHICRDLGVLKALISDRTPALRGNASLRSRLDKVLRRPDGQLPRLPKGARPIPAGKVCLHISSRISAGEDEDDVLEARYKAMRKERDSMWIPCWTGQPPYGHVQEQWSQVPPQGVMFPQFPAVGFSQVQPVPAGCVYVGSPCGEQPYVVSAAPTFGAERAQAQPEPRQPHLEQQIDNLLLDVMTDAGDDQQQIKEMLVRAMPDHYDD